MALRGTTDGRGAPKNEIEIIKYRPWENYVRPVKMGPHIYNVSGNDWLAIYIVDTGDGLVMIDAGVYDCFYLTLANLSRLGLNVMDIKYLFLTHGHGDHWGGARIIQELTGAKVFLSREDYNFYFVDHPEATKPVGGFYMPSFRVDEFYDDDKPITLGNMTFHTRLVPGHSVGATAFFFEDTDEETGKVYKVGLHGGIGIGSMSDARLDEFHIPHSIRQRFRDDLQELKKMDIDICLPGHSTQIGVVQMMEEMRDDQDWHVFADKSIWPELMQQRWDLAKELDP